MILTELSKSTDERLLFLGLSKIELYIIAPWYPQGIVSRLPLDTEISSVQVSNVKWG